MKSDSSKKKSYPRLPQAHWWNLRDKLKQSIPGTITDIYLASTLNMQVRSARANILPYLRDIGLIDEDGKTNIEMATSWRDDQQYQEVCREIRERIYPEGLLSASPNPSEDRNSAERWFANTTGQGKSAVGAMAKFYEILMEADVSKRPDKKQEKNIKQKIKKDSTLENARSKTSSLDSSKTNGDKKDKPDPGENANQDTILPSVNIRLEIHISSDATPDQIDKIFASMAKHIYKKQ